jgi:hypothetical protein
VCVVLCCVVLCCVVLCCVVLCCVVLCCVVLYHVVSCCVMSYLCAFSVVRIAAQMLGLAEGALGHTLPYIMSRTQFGQPIGDFQCIFYFLFFSLFIIFSHSFS